MPVRHKVDGIELLFNDMQDELLNPNIPFNKVVFLEKLPEEFNKENKGAHDKFKRLQGVGIPLFHRDDLVDVRQTLVKEFPYAVNIIDNLLKPTFRRMSAGKEGLVFEPTILVGEPGLGKTRLLSRLLDELDIYHRKISVAGMQDDQIFGVAKGFNTAMPSIMSTVIHDKEIGNPVFILDEIDKAQEAKFSNIQHKLLGLLEKDEAMNWHEPYLQVPMNLYYVGWLMTANTLTTITEPLKSRCHIMRMPAPELEHIPQILNTIRTDLALDDGLDPRFIPGFDEAEKSALVDSYACHKSVRVLKRQVKEILSMRELTLQ
jgi:ATP-dependent Lon protease